MVRNNPYLPSAASVEGLAQDTAAFRDLSGLTGVLSILLGLTAAATFACLLLVLLIMKVAAVQEWLAAGSPAPAVFLAQGVALAQVLLTCISALTFLRWIYLAHKNLAALGARTTGFSPAWAVGCLFVPLIQLWAPFRAMQVLAKASRNAVRWDLEDTPAVVVAWWALWLAGLGLSLGMNLLQLQSATMVLFDGLVATPLYLLALLMVRGIWRDQAHQHDRLLEAARAA